MCCLRRFLAEFNKGVALLGKVVKVSIWHKRLGHHLRNVVCYTQEYKQFVSVDSFPSVCSSCLSGKMCRQPFPVKETRTSVLFEKVHSDV